MIRTIRVKRKAFTLVEMLVTIMIILLLAGLIMPVIHNVKERGRDIKCKNHLKQLQVAAISYCIDHDGELPHSKSGESWKAEACSHGYSRAWRKTSTGWIDWYNYSCHHHKNRNYRANDARPGQVRWWGSKGLQCITNGTLWSYVGEDIKVYSCPEWLKPGVCGLKDPKGNNLTFDSTNNYPWRCYVMNGNASGNNIGSIEGSKKLLFTEYCNTNFLDSTRVSERNMMTDADAGRASYTEWHAWDGHLSGTTISANPKNRPYENVGLYHRNKANAVFVDGHIERITWQDTTNACKALW